MAVIRKAHVLVLSAAVVAVALIAVVVTEQKLLLAPLVCAFAAVTLTYGEHRRADHLQALLVHQATTELAAGRVFLAETSIVSAIRRLVEGRP